ncbi:phosphatidylserine/phosphatidylglycerophosphate/cardiolipin synthase family protein [Shewanella sp. MBTL60-007]|uniref:phospholipase D-like domain-containing protein n=1 Tax=Shewanella sp. MBTL60-007 TaxID=2815911 RepID=UPI001BC04D51|nr:phospholipase D family protein [Shewanella sp. MBTL60-007]GIU29733.1 phospholipase D family protein [Shewanella sp. MBTL60-007]
MNANGLQSLTFLRIIFLCAALSALIGCQSSPVYPEKAITTKLAAQPDWPLVQYIQADVKAHPQQTGVLPLTDGIDAFIARLALVNAATASIDLQYYIYRGDDTGRLLTWHLIDAAQRGVRVRILLDDMAVKDADEALVMLAEHKNIQVRLYNPTFERDFRNLAFVAGFSRLNHRMHNKSFTVDNTISIVGGRNIGNEYFSNDTNVEFGDFDLMTIGPAVDEISDQFDIYWNSPLTVEVGALTAHSVTAEEVDTALALVESEKAAYQTNPYMARLLSSELITQMQSHALHWYWGSAKLVYDQPDKQNHQLDSDSILADLGEFLRQAEKEVFIISPYFVPTREGTQNIIEAARAGIDITILTNSLAATDVIAVHAGYRQYRQPLLEAGVKIYEVKANPEQKKASSWTGSSKSSLHAKTFITDKQSTFVGSFNFDPRSAWLNTEMGLIIDNEQLAGEVVDGIEASLARNTYRLAIEEGELIWFDDLHQRIIYTEPDAGLWRKFLVDCIALLPIESQL